MKLWDKGQSIDKLFEQFTIGKDYELDIHLAPFDILATKAHVKMLAKIGLLAGHERDELLPALDELFNLCEKGEFVIEEGIEDCHSQIELSLTRKLGDIGKKVHSGRSRNDQVVTALKLYTKAEIKTIADLARNLFETLLSKSEKHKRDLMPGYTHMQVAMPSSFGLWFSAYAESLTDDMILLKAAFEMADKNPLGSGAGYGSSFPLDRDFTTKEMGFSDLNVNSIYAQMTRGKLEKTVGTAIAGLAATLAKFSMDVCLFSGQDYGFLNAGKEFTTGSSIMPHKHNPDGFELVRGKCNLLQALPTELSYLLINLPSGYHRDLQSLKEKYIPAIEELKIILVVLEKMTASLEVNSNAMDAEKYSLTFSVESVNNYVIQGVPFRDAYKKVGEEIASGTYIPNKELKHTHLGSIGNFGLDRIKERFEATFKWIK